MNTVIRITSHAACKRAIDLIFDAPQDGTLEMVLRKHDPHRNLEQNALMQRMVRTVADATGTDHDTARWKLCAMFTGTRQEKLHDGTVLTLPVKTTSQMSKSEMSEFIDWLGAQLADWGLAA